MYKLKPHLINVLIPLSLLLVGAVVARADFTPIPLTPDSYSQDAVVENTAPPPINSFVNATMDGGTNKNGNTWYERGYNPANPTHGIVPHGGVFASASDPTHSFQMPPTYATNCAIMLGHNNGSATAILPNGTFTVTTPAAYLKLSVLSSSGNGPVPVQVVVHHADATSETFSYSSRDWFNTSANATNAAGRVQIDNGNFNNEGSNPAGAIFADDFSLANTTSPVTSIDFNYAGTPSNNGRACIFAVSGSTDGTTYTPITVSGYDFDPVVEATATPDGNFPAGIITATMDAGTNKTGYTWYEQGYYTNLPTTGLPAAGSTITSLAFATAHYTLAPSWSGSNVVMVDQVFSNATITLATPAAYGGLSFLLASGNGDNIIPVVIAHQDGTTETNIITAFDWFKTSVPYAFQARGGVQGNHINLNNLPEQVYQPTLDRRAVVAIVRRLFDSVVVLNNTASPVTSIQLMRTNGAASGTRCAVFAVSGSPVGSPVAPFIPSQAAQPGGAGLLDTVNFTTAKRWAGSSNLVLSVGTVLGTGPFTYQWQAAPRGGGAKAVFDYSTFLSLTDNGTNLLGSTTPALTITNPMPANSMDYLVIISNASGSVTSAVASIQVFSTNIVDIPLPGDSISSFGGTEPATETADHAVDDLVGTDPGKWLNFGGNSGTPFLGPVGFIVQPSQGASVVSGLRLYTANDTTGRDPEDIMLEGSNDGGATWTTVYSNGLSGTLALPMNRNNAASSAANPVGQNCTELLFNNAGSYSSYRVTIGNVYNPLGVNSMQVGEIELLGTLSPAPPTIASQPQNETIYAGGSGTFSVGAVGPGTLAYQWYTNGTTDPSGSNSVYTFPNAPLTASGTTFRCVVTNIYGSATSATATLTVLPVPAHPYPTVVMADGPLSYWRLDETAVGGNGDGLVAKDYAGGRNGIYHLVQVDNGTGTLQPGFNPSEDPDTSAGFGTVAGQTQDSFVGNIPNLNLGATNGSKAGFSVETWVRGIGFQGLDAGIVTKGFGGGGEQFNLDCGGNDPAHDFRFYMRDGTAAVNSPVHAAVSTVADDGQWHHLVGVVDEVNGTVKLYVDGVQNGTVATIGAVGVMSSTYPVNIGARTAAAGSSAPHTLQFNGTIDDTAVYGYALSSTQVLSHFFASQPAPHFTQQPWQPSTNFLAGEHGNFTFRSSAYGPPPGVTYQWYQSTDGGATFHQLTGMINSNLTLTNLSATLDQSQYEVVASDAFGSTTSAPPAILTVASGAPFVINDLPASTFALAGATLTLEADFGGASPIVYKWTRNGANLADGGRISGSSSNILTIAYATAADTGNYQVTASNTNGPAANSVVDAVTVIPDVSFRTNGVNWSTNGSGNGIATFNGNNVLQLTFNKGGTATSAWFDTPIPIDNWAARFLYQDATPGATHLNGGADGIAFCLQNDNRGAAALGGGGGSLGVSGITPSAELELNIYPPNTPGITLESNGTIPPAGSAGFAPTSPADVDTGDPIQFVLNYSIATGILSVNLTDTTTGSTFHTNYTVGDLSALLGAHTATVGFTAADGGVASIQYISNFAFLPPQPSLGALLTSSNSLVLVWSASGGGYTLQSAPALATTGPTTWATVTNNVAYSNGTNSVTISPVPGDKFYRLSLQLQ